MSRKMANGSSRNNNEPFDYLISDDASEVDPSYKMFLEHLRQNGKSYVIDVPDGDHGMPTSVMYEEDDILCVVAMDKDGTNVPNSSPHRNRGGPNKAFDSLIGDDVSEVDPSYKMFLEHLSQNGKSYVIDVPDGDHGMPASVMYEEDDISSVVAMDINGTNVPNSSPHRNWGGSNAKRTGVTSGRDAHINVKEMNTSIDESYAAFLSLMKIEDGFMVVEPEPGVTFVYEQEDETPVGYDESYTEPSDFDVCEDDPGSPLAFSCGAPSTFDEKLDSVLSQPYDQNEYEELLRKATDRQPVSRQRHLRNASKRYATDVLGLSYLDHYPDLAIQIKYADTDEGRLNLLRKFFFWLENLTHEGAHMPWIPKAQACDPIVADDYE